MNKWFWVGIVAIACVVVALLLYTNPAEKARMAYENALAVELKADYDQAQKLYDEIVSTYPDSEAAKLAEAGKQRITEKREALLKQEMLDQVERILLVLNGYRSMYGRLPASIGELDSGEYFFDSDYLSELVPQGYTTYVVIGDNVRPGIWPLRADKETVYAALDLKGELHKMTKDEARKQIDELYSEAARKGGMVFLQKK